MLNNNTNISKIMTRHVKIVNSDTNMSKLVMHHVQISNALHLKIVIKLVTQTRLK